MKNLLICIKRILQNINFMFSNKKYTKTREKVQNLHFELYFLVLVFSVLNFDFAISQIYPANPSNWQFLEGNAAANKHNSHKSNQQSIDSILIKWSTPLISGEVHPLIGNIINNQKLNDIFTYAPNELAAVMGDKIVVVNGNGKIAKIFDFPEFVRGVRSISLLLDTLSPDINGSNLPVVMLTESMETSTDSVAHSYIFTYNTPKDTILISRRLAVDMRAYKPNIYASIKPFAGKLYGTDLQIYSTVNTHTPEVPNQNPPYTPFLRGLLKFSVSSLTSGFPVSDVGDDVDYRITMGPEVNLFQPSVSVYDEKTFVALPTFPSVADSILVNNPITLQTRSNRPYLVGFDITDNTIREAIFPRDFKNIANGKRPLVRPYWVDLTDEGSGENMFILVTEEYNGLEGSVGKSKLHLYTKEGDPITFPGDAVFPPIVGGDNHYWSVAMGNVDGNSWNENKPHFPNNPGKELIITQSTPNYAYPSNKLMVVRYQTNGDIAKPSPPGTYLYQFDTICTQRINGWVAAVNDFDGLPNNKDEIFLVSGGTLRILTMRAYKNEKFQSGKHFDTLFTHTFVNQNIFSVSVADMEGDGRNDLIVTTNDSTYLIGSFIPNSLKVLNPILQQSPPEMLCYGDTLQLKWTNYTLSENQVQIKFQRTIDSIPTWDSLQVINNNVNNNCDTCFYNLVIDDKLSGKEGFFVLSGIKNPSQTSDSSAIMSFEIPRFNLDEFATIDYNIGDKIIITGNTKCVDSLSMQIATDTASWQFATGIKINPNQDFVLKGIVPCLPVFNCSSPDSSAVLLSRLIIHRTQFNDTSQVYSLNILPAPLPITLEPCLTNCPTLVFSWDTLYTIPLAIDTINFYFSDKLGDSLTIIGSVPADSLGFSWNIPYNLPNKIHLRACSNSSCFRFDTILTDVSPKYINTVSPNPFRPNFGEMEIVYEIPVNDDISIRIIDQANRIVKNIIENQPRKSNIVYCDSWNGYNMNNEPVANGMYYILFEQSNGAKEIYPVFIRK